MENVPHKFSFFFYSPINGSVISVDSHTSDFTHIRWSQMHPTEERERKKKNYDEKNPFILQKSNNKMCKERKSNKVGLFIGETLDNNIHFIDCRFRLIYRDSHSTWVGFFFSSSIFTDIILRFFFSSFFCCLVSNFNGSIMQPANVCI